MSRTESYLEALNSTAKSVVARKLSALSDGSDVQPAVAAARSVWGWSAAYKLFGDKRALMMASRCKDAFLEKFVDHKYGGVFFSIDGKGERLDTDKKTDSIAASIFGLSEYAMATGDKDALRQAYNLFENIEVNMLVAPGQYVEQKTRDWSAGSGDQTVKLATLLHVLEGYTNLYKAGKDARVRASIEALLERMSKDATSLLTNYGHWFSLGWQYVYTTLLFKDADLVNKFRPVAHECVHSGFEALASQTSTPQLWIEGEEMISSLFMWRINGCAGAIEKTFAAWESLKKDYPTMQDDLYHTCRMTFLINELMK